MAARLFHFLQRVTLISTHSMQWQPYGFRLTNPDTFCAVTAAVGNLEEQEWNGLPGSTSIPNFVKISWVQK